jgi:hypothetical protein
MKDPKTFLSLAHQNHFFQLPRLIPAHKAKVYLQPATATIKITVKERNRTH